jgi:hypothetical protein
MKLYLNLRLCFVCSFDALQNVACYNDMRFPLAVTLDAEIRAFWLCIEIMH